MSTGEPVHDSTLRRAACGCEIESELEAEIERLLAALTEIADMADSSDGVHDLRDAYRVACRAIDRKLPYG